MREALASKPVAAFAALVYTLAAHTFFGEGRETCLDIRLTTADLRSSAEGIGASLAVAAMAERHRRWRERLPEEPQLWEWVRVQERDTLLELLAYCAATTLNALVRHADRDGDRLQEADLFAAASELDMRSWWTATRESYFSRVSKSQIIAAVAEAVSAQAAENIAGMKKEAMAGRAAELLQGTGWLPEPLRSPESASAPTG